MFCSEWYILASVRWASVNICLSSSFRNSFRRLSISSNASIGFFCWSSKLQSYKNILYYKVDLLCYLTFASILCLKKVLFSVTHQATRSVDKLTWISNELGIRDTIFNMLRTILAVLAFGINPKKSLLLFNNDITSSNFFASVYRRDNLFNNSYYKNLLFRIFTCIYILPLF